MNVLFTNVGVPLELTLGLATKVGGSGTKIHKKGRENTGPVAAPQQDGTLTNRMW